MSIDNLRVRTKALVSLLVMALGVTATVAFGAMKFTGISGAAGRDHRT